MSEENKGNNVYITSENKTVVAKSASADTKSILTFATVSASEGTGSTYSCTADLSVTTSNDMVAALAAGDAYIKFATNDKITAITDTAHDLKDVTTDFAEPTGLSFEIADGETIEIKGSVYIVNKESEQNQGDNDISGKTLGVAVTVNNLKCDVKNPVGD